MNDAIPRDVPFSLSCIDCDGDSPETYEDAVKDGWTDIQFYPEGASENFLGLCPDCRREEQRLQEKIRQTFSASAEKGGGPCPT